jgi:ATP-dependent Lon protease
VNIDIDSRVQFAFPDVAVNKALSRKYGGSDRAVPDYVTDWLVSRYSTDSGVDDERIEAFLAKHLPDKKHKHSVLYALNSGSEVKILDAYTVRVDITKGRLVLEIPSLDLAGTVSEWIVDENPLLLHGNLWGSGTLARVPVGESDDRFEIRMVDFKPMQTSIVDLDYYVAQRALFGLAEWKALLVGSMGYSPTFYSSREQSLLLTRLAPLVQPRLNLIELAPKGTGKSYVYSRLSRYAWLISGGVVTRAQLFYNMNSKAAGVITRFDTVVLDEVQTIRLENEGEIIGALKGYLEQGEFRVMQYKGSADAGFVLLANIPFTRDGKPRNPNLLSTLPQWLRGENATALLDRFHGLVPGGELPKISSDALYGGMALRADYLGEILHALRSRGEYIQWVREHTCVGGSADLRDKNAVERLSAAYLKLLFPDLASVTLSDFNEHCLEPAKALRSRIRRQLAMIDAEFSAELAEIDVDTAASEA